MNTRDKLVSSSIVIKTENRLPLFNQLQDEKETIESELGFAYSLELLSKCNRLKLNISEIPAQWEERSEGSSRFKIFKWLPEYLRWYFYGLATTWLRKSAQEVNKRV